MLEDVYCLLVGVLAPTLIALVSGVASAAKPDFEGSGPPYRHCARTKGWNTRTVDQTPFDGSFYLHSVSCVVQFTCQFPGVHA
ncbi:hypothetical protein BKA62DRAFT_717757 [Auriculariales sp. MPI-PUGE-AT-0066]|nr:hypothetical protein BKA62DRAFT_717757 [Auriculariales sp. MPI-PUGE-AT-0066]